MEGDSTLTATSGTHELDNNMTRTIRTLDLDQLIPDPDNERTEAPDKEAIARLADSITLHGVLQRLLVRPVNGRFMIVAGHRRLMAAQQAGLKRVPVEIRELDDDAARALQIVENLHREDVTPLDEAKAFERLRSEDRSIGDVAALVGHTPRYVAQRLSLVNLAPDARKALAGRRIALGTANLLARIGNPKVQREALRSVESDADSPISVARARRVIEENFELNLADAPFDPGDENLVKGVPSCMACPKRAGNQPLLFEGADAEARCTDPVCFRKKARAAFRKKARELRADDQVVHAVKASAEEFFVHGYSGPVLKDEWITPEQRASYETNLTWGKILAEELRAQESGTYVTHPDTGEVIRVFPRSKAMQVARAQGHAWAGAKKKRTRTKAEQRAAKEAQIGRLVEEKVNEALRVKLDQVSLDERAAWLAEAILDSARCDSLRLTCSALGLKREKEVQTRYGKEKESWRDRLARAIKEKAFTPKVVFLEVLTREQGWHHRTKGAALRDRLLAELTIDVKEIERKARAEVPKGEGQRQSK